MDEAVTRPDTGAGRSQQRHEFGIRLGELARLWRGQIDRHLRPVGVSFMQWLTLSRLADTGEDVVQKDLAALVGMEGSTMVGVLDRLVESELVERRVAAHDRRANTVHITAGGRQILRDAEVELRKLRDGLLSGLSDADMAVCIRVFERVSGAARRFEPDMDGTAGG